MRYCCLYVAQMIFCCFQCRLSCCKMVVYGEKVPPVFQGPDMPSESAQNN